MAQAVEEGSDVCILTSDNPRSEDPKQIIADAQKGFRRKSHTAIVDREIAIKTAILNATEGDIVLVAGKGHEAYQEINGVKHPFDDRRWAAGYWRARNELRAVNRRQREAEETDRRNQYLFQQWEQRMREGLYDDSEDYHRTW
jgi:UDP-N-acetylmuramoyl-L-alanyl-D-glutamate--2,6-diaminopimelate ligase